MRVIRSTMYPPPGLEGTPTVVMREKDLLCSFESLQEDLLHKTPEVLVVFDIFEMADDTEILQATLEAKKRQEEASEKEQHLRTLFYWMLMQLERLNPNGYLMSPRPAPLDAEDMRKVFFQLARTKYYQKQTIIAFDQNLVRVEHNANSIDPLTANVT